MTDKEFIQSISLPDEQWCPVKDFEDYYVVSSFGRIVAKSRTQIYHRYNKEVAVTTPTKLLNPQPSGINSAYMSIGLYKDKKRYPKNVHRLVADAFLPNLANYPCINHIDGNGHNNILSNLEWCNYKYNNNYPITKERMKSSASLDRGIKVIQLSISGEMLNVFPSLREAERVLEISRHLIKRSIQIQEPIGQFVFKDVQ